MIFDGRFVALAVGSGFWDERIRPSCCRLLRSANWCAEPAFLERNVGGGWQIFSLWGVANADMISNSMAMAVGCCAKFVLTVCLTLLKPLYCYLLSRVFAWVFVFLCWSPSLFLCLLKITCPHYVPRLTPNLTSNQRVRVRVGLGGGGFGFGFGASGGGDQRVRVRVQFFFGGGGSGSGSGSARVPYACLIVVSCWVVVACCSLLFSSALVTSCCVLSTPLLAAPGAVDSLLLGKGLIPKFCFLCFGGAFLKQYFDQRVPC